MSDNRAQQGTSVRFRATDRREMDARVSAAVERLIPEALVVGEHGILVTRTSATDITVELHPDVPFGEVHDRQEW